MRVSGELRNFGDGEIRYEVAYREMMETKIGTSLLSGCAAGRDDGCQAVPRHSKARIERITLLGNWRMGRFLTSGHISPSPMFPAASYDAP